MKNFLKVTVIFGLLLNVSHQAVLFSMEKSDQSAYQIQDALLKRLVGVEGKLGHVTDPRLSGFVTFSLQQVDVMRQLAMRSSGNIEFLNALAKNEVTFEQSRTRFIRLYEMLFNLQSLFESLKKENMLHVIVDVVPNLKKIYRYFDALGILRQKDREFWPCLLYVPIQEKSNTSEKQTNDLEQQTDGLEQLIDCVQTDHLDVKSFNDGFIEELEGLFESVNDFKNKIDQERRCACACFDKGCDEDFDVKGDRREKYAKKVKSRKQRRSDASSKSQR